jgi:23S rRNA (cytidine1920-2'-O)/16S rRNA (cytidine1409-2'-O)-methyltransferase
MNNNKKRLDILLFEKGLAKSRESAKAIIMAGKVFVNNEKTDKPGRVFFYDDEIIIKGDDIPYVSRGGLKLEAALKSFDINIKNLYCIDIGASTGGFTDCLLQFGAKHVFAVDVGYGQFAWTLRNDKRVTLIERTNIRYLEKKALPYSVDIAAIDVSFISLKIVALAALKFLKPDAHIIALIKPQFEVGKGKVGKNGVVKDKLLHDEVIKNLTEFFTNNNLICNQVIPSPITGPKGNKEFLIYLSIEPVAEPLLQQDVKR